MISRDILLSKYTQDPFVQQVIQLLQGSKKQRLQFKNLAGSADALLSATIHQLSDQPQLIILHDREEAAYFLNDLQNLTDKEILLFPSSFKKPYQPEETENANVLLRAETLNKINHSDDKQNIIISYPEALTEKVINKTALEEHTFRASIGEEVDVDTLRSILLEFGFEITDFVYEVGQFAIRGGIIDVFSFGNDLPYRIELFGDEIDSIRTFDPENQLSVESVENISLIPNIKTQIQEEERISFLQFLPENTQIWIKDEELLLDTLDKVYEKADSIFEDKQEDSGGAKLLLPPDQLFENSESFSKSLNAFSIIAFGNRFLGKSTKSFDWGFKAQPNFNKDFNLLVEDLKAHQDQHYQIYLIADVPKQRERLLNILEEIAPDLKVEAIPIALRGGFIDTERNITCYTDHQIFERFHRYKAKQSFSKSKALTLKELRSLKTGDYVTHIDHGVGRFAGLEKVEVNGRSQETVRLIYRDNDLLFVGIHSLHKISKYTGKEGIAPQMSKLGSAEWEKKKSRVKKKVQDIAKDLIALYAKRKEVEGYAFDEDSFLQAELESSFIYEDTPDQAKATADVKRDMQAKYPMDRLVCGDVGFGKTEVAIRAAFKAVTDGKQAAVLVPTTILAMQHHKTFENRLQNLPVRVDYINRFRTAKQVREILKDLKEGKIDILIGTHRLVNKDVVFKDLGLLVIDEEQKFGVKVKDRLKEMRVNVDVLTLTATPIPRTLHFSLMGARDLSVIATPPPNRQPVTTEIHTFNESIIRDAVDFEVKRGGQVFFVHNRIGDIEAIASLINRLVPDARVTFAHGQMEGPKLEKIMTSFIEGEFDVLISTNIIESGLDIPNANTIIINQAHMFGLSDLHQMRGRVGRSNIKAFCYLLSPPTSTLTSEARKRLSTLEEFTDLGDGFKVAMRDLDIRGAGNLLGAEQSGFISDLGFELYHKILDEAVTELKNSEEFRDLFDEQKEEKATKPAKECVLETDLELLIPEEYITNTAERLNIYSQLDKLEPEDLQEYTLNLEDRFGALPEQVQNLILAVKLRATAQELGFEKLLIKGTKMKAYVIGQENTEYFQSEVFGKILQYVQLNARRCQIKEIRDKLMVRFSAVDSIEEAYKIFQTILD
ncbi:transcription-repair coupling factor [Persicobacter diffluens]|uniref:Transcription-repair-coupling factor n=1 Tax=Persicobacter diffluens TaxID=981 RepID=A0AAN4W0V3_9BACT|nr:transcription-repair-coupling factor [Persicobacter diffluens]